ncbi:hypothetical protein [Escherichia sp. E2748]|uniref:hypothetical protein n=1 Tax=Escherichia sp. E2748 TaxID=2044460 RepID=UPI001484EC9E|nr:hypothetical protein [Escherichia sp. E2748]
MRNTWTAASITLALLTSANLRQARIKSAMGSHLSFSFGFAASICLTVSMGKNPVGKIILSTFYPSWSAAVTI